MPLGPLPDVPNVARVKMSGTNQGTPWVALFYFHYLAGTVTSADMVSLSIGFSDAWGTTMAPAFVSSVTLDAVEAWDLSNRSGAQGSGGTTKTGSRVGSPLPVNIAAVASWKVNYRWRGGHARTYWPAGAQADVNSGHLWSGTARAAFETANGAFLSTVNALTVGGQGGYLTLVRYVHTPVKGEPPVYFNPPLDLRIQDVLVDARLDTQRRRLGPDL